MSYAEEMEHDLYSYEGEQEGGVVYYLTDFKVIMESKKGIQIRHSKGKEWFPKAHTSIDRQPFHGMSADPDRPIFVVEAWLARTKTDIEWSIYDY